MEFWVGWFDAWGNKEHSLGNIDEHAKDLKEILAAGNVNIYMFMGGTNFGYMNGANYYDEFAPTVTSYDYDALLTEAGEVTEKYRAFQRVIGKHKDLKKIAIPERKRPRCYGVIRCDKKAGLFPNLDRLSKKQELLYPKSMEQLGQGYGFILYRTKLRQEPLLERIRLYGANDRAILYLDEEPILTLYDKDLQKEHFLNKKAADQAVLSILVENMGRVNFGPALELQRKGIDGNVVINGYNQYDWEVYPLPLDDISSIDYQDSWQDQAPGFYSFRFEAEETGDTYVDVSGFGKGLVFINGFNLGRFWEAGPQKRLYLPAPLLKAGMNELVIFEVDGRYADTVTLSDKPDLGEVRV